MDFKKYSSIENSYQAKAVMFWLKAFPELKDELFILTEKIDGANLQLVFEPGVAEYKVGKRKSFLFQGSPFFDVWNTLARYDAETSVLQRHTDEIGKEVRVFGELFGPGINGRVNYGDKKKFRIFDIYIENILQSQAQLQSLAEKYKFKHLLVPTVAMITGLENALDFDEKFKSMILNIEGNLAEGFVLRPYWQVFRMPSGDKFVLKKKRVGFDDKGNGTKSKTPKEPLPKNIISLVANFQGYVNENRVLDTFSKYGPIESPKQIGEYIRYVLDDAKEDFLKDNPELDLDKSTAKIVFNVGKTIVELLKAHL